MTAALILMLWAQPASSDEAAVRQVVQRYVDARESRDAKATEALFTEDADQLVSSGEWRKGRAALVEGTIRSSQQNPGRRTIAVENVRFLAPGVALADGRYVLENESAGQQARRMWTTILLVKRPEGWKIAAIRNMLPSGR